MILGDIGDGQAKLWRYRRVVENSLIPHLLRLNPRTDGSELRTPRDAGNYIAKLPKREHDTPAWHTAIQPLMLVVEHGGDTMLPRIGIMRALYPGEPVPAQRRKPVKKYRIVK